jgi:acetyltransferase-like isoleucine patch superfamily enzyme
MKLKIKELFRRIRLKFWRTLAGMRHRYTWKYAKILGVNIADTVRFTGVPDFSTEPWLVTIGKRCLITQNVRFMTHDGSVHVVRSMGGKYKDIMKFGKIIVEDGVFIGANSTIMPSVRIGAAVLLLPAAV